MSSPREAQLAQYALGLLPEAERRVLDREIDTSADARSELDDAIQALEALALATEPVEPDPALEARILGALGDGPDRFAGFVDRLCALFDLGADRVREHLAAVAGVPGPPWESSGVPGVWLYHLDGGPSVAPADCGLVYHEPGAAFPMHGHRGEERALVLSGHAITDSGEHWTPGDARTADASHRHGFHATDEGPFVYAVVLEGRIDLDPSD